MSGAASDPKAEAMEVNEDEISNGLSDTMDVNESKGENPVAESKKPGKITRVSRKSSSSVSSERSASKESSKHSEGKDQKLNSSSDDEDFLGFSLPIDGSAREKYLRFLRKEKVSTGKENVPSGKDDDTTGKDNEPALVDDDVQSQSDKMSVENVDSDSNAENTTPTKSVVTKSVSVKKSSIDIDKDEYKKPFEFGWVREVVYRTSSLNSSERTRRSADVYYYTPSGKKVRSSREVADYLTGELSIANFTFVKEPIGVNDPKKEIVRHAEPNRSLRSGDESSSPQQKKATPTIRAKPKSTNEVQGKGTTPKVAFKFTNKKLSAGKKPDKSRKSIGGTEIEDDSSEDTDWDMVQKKTNGLKRVSDSSVDDDAPPAKVSVKVKEVPPKYLPNNFFSMSNAVTMSMHYFFQYLKVHELLRATQVNKTWHFIATHQSLWETVRMKNSKVRDFEGFGNALRKYNTKSLDLRKMITPESPEATTEMWSRLASVISTLPNLKRVDFGRCAPSAIEVVAAACSHLESVTSLSIRGSDLNLSPITNCLNLVELKLKSFGGIDVKNLHLLKQLTNLKSLYLTSVKNLEGIDQALPESLENLELGECVKLPEKFAVSALPKLVNLKRLRLERGGTGCPTLPILHTIASLPKLTQLELINFDIKPGFDKALSKCTNIKILLIIPTYVTQSATTNHVVMGGVSKLSASLQYFIWGLTLELLRVTDLFIDQVEGGKSKSGGATGRKTGAGDSIPILKPLGEDGSDSSREGSASQVDILGLPKLQRVLSTLLPQTKIKILKIPLSATWRQTVTDIPV
uniref:MBD domain-containing protein n=1 Tax=Lygus hesperus TaxID=30085 RepID=A0A0K8SRS3_LYGHE